MTTFLPYRGRVFCSLGHLIDGQFADSYLQQSGLIFCRGSVRLAGIVRPDVGTVVSFAYSRDDVTAARIPRVLRVLSSFADPFTQITTVQLGCKLTLLQNSRQPDQATPEESDPILNPGVGLNVNATDYVAPPVGALPAAQKCLTKLGITAAAPPLPLENRYTVSNVDLSEGYVSVLGKLLESELYVGWLNENEELEVRDLRIDTDALGPVLNNTNVFTLSPIGVGELPAETVNVTYTPLGLRSVTINETGSSASEKLSDITKWSQSTTTGFPVVYRIDYTAAGVPTSFIGTYTPVQETTSVFKDGVMVESVSTALKPYAAAAGKYASQALSNGISVSTSQVANTSVTQNTYNEDGQVVRTTLTESVSLPEFAGKLDLTFVFSPTDYIQIPDSGRVITQKTITSYSYNGDAVRREVTRYVNWALTSNGQQAINEGRQVLANSGAVANFVNSLVGEPAYEGTEVTVSDSGPQAQRLPEPADLAGEAYGDGRESKIATSTFSFGAVNSQSIATFSLPYTSDSYFNNVVLGEWVTVDQTARAQSLALNYGRIQNRLRLGNAQGVSLQLPVELLPTRPFDALYLQAGGLTGQYRANGMSWTFDQNGIVGQVDALFWLAIGQEGTPGPIWFPMAPGVTALPATPGPTVNTTPAPANSATLPGGWNPAAPDLTTLFGATLPTGVAPVFPSTLDVSTGLEPFNETVALDAVTRSVLEVVDVPYSLVPQAAIADMVTHAVFIGVGGEIVAPPPGIDLASIVYTQSSVHPGNSAATNAGMTNGVTDETEQTATDFESGPWIRMDFGDVYPVANIVVGCDLNGTLANTWGPDFAANHRLESSTDGTSWTNRVNTGTFSTATKTFAVSFDARYVRIRNLNTAVIAITEFYATST
jgi:F5/8 type C domain